MTPRRNDRRRAAATPATRTGGTVACILGVVGVTVGLGVGVSHVLRAGLTPLAVVGLAALVVGLALLLRGALTLLRGRSRWLAPPVVVALLGVTALSVFTVGQGLAATVVPSTAVGSATPASRGLPYRDVRTRTSDGVVLSGWYVPGTNGAGLVLLHGAGSTRSAVLDHAAVLARNGYGVLLLDARGHGRSGGRAMDFGWYGDLDARAGVDAVARQPDVENGRIGVVGLSMGGEEAIGAAAADPRIRAVVAEGATHRSAADREWLPQVYGAQGSVQVRLDQLTYAAAALLSGAEQPTPLRTAVADAARPVLLIAGGDVPDEQHAARWVASGSPGVVTTWVVPGAGHTAGLRTRPHEWEQRVVAFLDEALRG